MIECPRTKTDFYKRWNECEFGNRIRSFDSMDSLITSGFSGRVSIRYKEPGSPFCKYEVPIDEVISEVNKFVEMGAVQSRFTFNESAPDSYLEIQGEIIRTIRHIELVYSTDKLPMRTALAKSPQWCYGLEAYCILKRYLWPKSQQMIFDLLDIYDGAVEFSCYRIPLGNIFGHNTIIWEVRNY
jgi:hypothetical protein